MPSNPDWRRAGEIVLRAFLYASAITLLVLFLPSGEHVFIYQEF